MPLPTIGSCARQIHTPDDKVMLTRRHLLVLATRGAIHHVTASHLIHLLDMLLPDQTEHMDFTYETPVVGGEPWPACAVLSMDLRLQVLEGRIRIEEDKEALFPEILTLLSNANELTGAILDDWSVLKNLHRIIINVSHVEDRFSLYARIMPRISLEALRDSVRAWKARLFACAAEAAYIVNEHEAAYSWHSCAKNLLAGFDYSATLPAFLLANRDLQYQVTWTERFTINTLREMIALHWQVLNLLPLPNAEWSEERWLRRWRKHIFALLELSGWNDAWDEYFMRVLVHWPPYAETAALLADVHVLMQGNERVRSAIRDLAKRKKAEIVGDAHSANFLHFELTASPRVSSDTLLSKAESLWVANRTLNSSSHVSTETRDVMLLTKSILLRENSACETKRFIQKRLAVLMNEMLDAAPKYFIGTDLIVFQRVCIQRMVRLYLGSVFDPHRRTDSNEEFAPKINRAGTNAKKSIDALFLRHVVAGNTNLLHDWTIARITLADRMANIARHGSFSGQVDLDYWTQNQLFEFMDQVSTMPHDKTVSHLVRYRIMRYLWIHDESVKELEAYLDRPIDVSAGMGLPYGLILSVMPLFMTPRLLQSSYSPSSECQERFRCMFLTMLNRYITSKGDLLGLRFDLVSDVLKNPTCEQVWSDLVKATETRLGSPTDFWKNVQESLLISDDWNYEQSATHPSVRLDVSLLLGDLTDSAALRLTYFLLQYGSGLETLSMPLRRGLSEAAVSAAMGSLAWDKSLFRPGIISGRWRCASAILMALSLRDDGALFGHKRIEVAPGKFKEWRQLMYDYMGVQARGAFREHVREVRKRARETLSME